MEADTRKQALRDLLCIQDGNSDLLNSEVCKTIGRIIEHRRRLRTIGRNLPGMMDQTGDTGNATEKLDEELVRLNTSMQKDDIIPDTNLQEIYSFVRDRLGIEDLKQTVFKSADILIRREQQASERKEEDRDRGLQTILGLFAILGIFSALTDGWDIIYRWFVDKEWAKLSRAGFLAEAAVVLIVMAIGLITIRYAFPIIYECITNLRNKEIER